MPILEKVALIFITIFFGGIVTMGFYIAGGILGLIGVPLMVIGVLSIIVEILRAK